MTEEIKIGIASFVALIAYWKSDFFISRRDKYVNSPYKLLQIRIGIALGFFIIAISIIH